LTTLFTSFGSFDPDGALNAFLWDFGDGSTSTATQVSHTFVAPGLYFVTLTVTDTGNAKASRSITVLAGTTLTVSSSRFNLNFQKLALDRLTLSSKTAPFAPDLITAGLTGSVRVGTAEFEFTLDEKGRFKSPQL